MFDKDLESQFDRQFKKARRGMIGFGIFGMILNLVFWLALIGGGIWLVKHFLF